MPKLDVCIPTKDSADVIGETLDALQAALDRSPFEAGTLRLDDASTDDTVCCVREWVSGTEWSVDVTTVGNSLPAAREELIRRVDTEWFLFVDDDVRVHEDYLDQLAEWTASNGVGAVHGRKSGAYNGSVTEWKRMRSRRGATHATLFRTAAVRGTRIPADLAVLEDEYLRRVVEARDYNWVFDARALLDHDCQERHPVGWEEGWLGGKYDLQPGMYALLHVPFAAATGRSPIPHALRAAGWVCGTGSRIIGGSPSADDTLRATATDGGERR